MPISNFPPALQPIIQQGWLSRRFSEGLLSQLAFRRVAARERIPNRIGETVIKTKQGWKAPVTTPLSPSANTNLDNGLTPSTWTLEQYVLKMNMYGDTIDLNMVTEKVGAIRQFTRNARVNGAQAAQSLDRLARNALFNAYLGGNTRVKTTLGSPAATLAVDDIRGFVNVAIQANGAEQADMVPVSSTNPMTVTVGAGSYTLIATAADGSNTSTAPNGVSGTLTFNANVTVNDGTSGNAVTSATGSTILRPNGRATTAAVQATDTFSMAVLLDAAAQMRSNNVPTDDGMYDCFLDPTSSRQLFSDPDFKLLYQGATAANEVFRMGRVIELVDVRLIPTTEVYLQPLSPGLVVHRPIVCGAEALVEGTFDGQASEDIAPTTAIIDIDDSGVVQVTREPLDRLGQIIAQSWYWIGGYAVPSDITANPTIIPTASNAAYKRAIVIEHGATK